MKHEAERKKSLFPSTQAKENEVRLDVKDTDFLLKLMLDSSFTGRELEQAYHTMTKVAKLHRQGINGHGGTE